jgi:hypothetical protein
VTKGYETKDHVFKIYAKEKENCGGNGYVASGKAVVTTELVILSELFHWASTFLQTKKDEAKSVVQEKTNN